MCSGIEGDVINRSTKPEMPSNCSKSDRVMEIYDRVWQRVVWVRSGTETE